MSSSTPAADWFHNAIIEGVQRLYALSLQGCPSAEVLPLTAVSWVDVLWDGRPWVEALDTHRLQAAFTSLARQVDRWPSPNSLRQHLPSRVYAAALPEPRPVQSPARRAELVAVRQQLVARSAIARPRPGRAAESPECGGGGALSHPSQCGTLSGAEEATAEVAPASQGVVVNE